MVVLLFTILFALSFKSLRVSFKVWRFLHKGAILIIVLGFIHALVVGSDLEKMGMTIYFWALSVAATGIFVYRNLFMPLFGHSVKP